MRGDRRDVTSYFSGRDASRQYCCRKTRQFIVGTDWSKCGLGDPNGHIGKRFCPSVSFLSFRMQGHREI